MDDILNAIEVLYDDAFPFSIIYHTKDNRLARVKKEFGSYLINMKSQPGDKDEAVVNKLQSFFQNAQQCMKEQNNFSESQKIKRLLLLVQNGCNLSCKYCYADGGT